ncbi:MAG: TatD family hydrolase [Spirochaetaceae bacterium]|jgi:TatD DNase family protein|nr:TatD family hydrolase [Spirochaetaceae bacterium]
MASDAHAHPYDLARLYPPAEAERRRLGIACAASAWNPEEFLFQEALAQKAREDGAPPLMLCYAVHPQLPRERASFDDCLDFLAALAAGKRICAIGETGFDLFDRSFKDTEAAQDALFSAHLETALRYGLPLVLHIRKAMHKVFSHAASLRRLPAVVLHSYSGTAREAGDLLKRGVNAYFSFGNTIRLNHKEAMRSCALLPAGRLLFETDAPYQPFRGRAFSLWEDTAAILASAASLRGEAGSPVFRPGELEAVSDASFFSVYGNGV